MTGPAEQNKAEKEHVELPLIQTSLLGIIEKPLGMLRRQFSLHFVPLLSLVHLSEFQLLRLLLWHIFIGSNSLL